MIIYPFSSSIEAVHGGSCPATPWDRPAIPLKPSRTQAGCALCDENCHSALVRTAKVWIGSRHTPDSAPETRGKGSRFFPSVALAPRPQNSCRICGTSIPVGRGYCSPCSTTSATERMPEVAQSGRIAAHTAEAEASRSATQRRNALARWEWQHSSGAAGIDEQVYDAQIQPQLKRLTNAVIASAIGVSLYYAAEIRRGRRRPHPRHWQTLTQLVHFSSRAQVQKG